MRLNTNPLTRPSGMAWLDLAGEATAGLLARPLRTALTVAGTVIGLTALVATLGLSRTAGHQIVGRFDELAATEIVVSPKPSALGGDTSVAPDPTALAGLMLGLRRPWPTLLLLAPELEAGATATATLRGARLRPVMTGSHVALVELGGDLRARLDQKWRNRLVRAEAAGLRIEIARGGRHLDWLLAAHGRLMARKRFRGPPPEFVADAVAAADPADVFVVAALWRSVPVAGALVLRHGRAATYWIAAAEPEGRAAQAGNLVLWRAMLALRDAGAATLDLGLVDTDRSPDLARFKLGTGAAVRTLCGTWTPCPV